MEMNNHNIVVEARMNDVLRCFELDVANVGLKYLRDRLCAQFECLHEPNEFVLKYVDDEGELVTLAFDVELLDALSIIAPGPLCLHLYPSDKVVVDTPTSLLPISLEGMNDLQYAEIKLVDESKLHRKHGKLHHCACNSKRREEKALRKNAGIEGKIKKREERMKRREERMKRKEERLLRIPDNKRKLDAEEKGDGPNVVDKKEERLRKRRQFADLSFHSLETDSTSQWPEGKDQLYIDGNNMLFLTNTLRSLTLHRNKRKAEAVLETASDMFTNAMGGVVKHTTLIFDNTSTFKEKVFPTLSPTVSMLVLSARPKFTTSDDALVAWAQADPEKARRSVYITSDRELSVRLLQAGGLIIKPKMFLMFANKIVNGESEGQPLSLDAWLDRIAASL